MEATDAVFVRPQVVHLHRKLVRVRPIIIALADCDELASRDRQRGYKIMRAAGPTVHVRHILATVQKETNAFRMSGDKCLTNFSRAVV
ncbi:MAG: hypothetical protein ABIP96_03270 [Patescibacteria group bacterium]